MAGSSQSTNCTALDLEKKGGKVQYCTLSYSHFCCTLPSETNPTRRSGAHSSGKLNVITLHGLHYITLQYLTFEAKQLSGVIIELSNFLELVLKVLTGELENERIGIGVQ